MGWKLKAFAFIFALAAIPFGAWIIAIPLFVYVASGLFRKKKRPLPVYVLRDELPSNQAAKPSRIKRRHVVGGVFLVLSVIALAVGGTYAPFVFAAIGATILLSGPVLGLTLFSSVEPVKDSVLVRKSSFPLSWIALAEVKLGTRDVAKVLSSAGEKILCVLSEKPVIYTVVGVHAFTHRGAEVKVLQRMTDIAATIAPMGAYLLPLESGTAISAMSFSRERLNLARENWALSLSTLPYDVISIRKKEWCAESIGIYRKDSGNGKSRPSVPEARQRPDKPPLLWEVIQMAGRRTQWPGPDSYTAFLSSVYASRNLQMGERIIDAGPSSDNQLVHVKSLSSPTVELSRPQLRAVMTTYA